MARKLAGKFVSDLTKFLLHLFSGVDTTDTSFESLADAHERIPEGSTQRTEFVEGYVALQTVWEFLDPHQMLLPFKQQYFWLAKVYESIRPKDVSKAFLWARLGAKTTELIHGHMNEVAVKSMASKTVTLDAAGLALVKRIAEQLRLPPNEPPGTAQSDVYQQVLDSIEARLKRRLAESDSPVYKSLAERIEKLRAKAIGNVEDSLAFLEEALKGRARRRRS